MFLNSVFIHQQALCVRVMLPEVVLHLKTVFIQSAPIKDPTLVKNRNVTQVVQKSLQIIDLQAFAADSAESEGFEPSIPFRGIHTFQACSFNHSDNSPDLKAANLGFVFQFEQFICIGRGDLRYLFYFLPGYGSQLLDDLF